MTTIETGLSIVGAVLAGIIILLALRDDRKREARRQRERKARRRAWNQYMALKGIMEELNIPSDMTADDAGWPV